jgi:glyoxylase-like metal-dependent hydrolase (beta-lactamase superfamily II)
VAPSVVGVQRDDVQQVADDVFRVRGRLVNWYLLRDGRDLTLVDAGYPGDADDVEASIRLLGHQPGDVRALLITHAHADHIGAAVRLHEQHGVPAYCSAPEVPHAHRDFLEQVTVGDLLPHLWRPKVLAWAVGAIRLDGLKPTAVPHALPFPTDGALDLPGTPVPVLTPGHTVGHSAYVVPGAGALISGDELVTGHPTKRQTGPQLLADYWHHDPAAAWSVLDSLAATDAGLLLPGHGEPWRGTMRHAVTLARA